MFSSRKDSSPSPRSLGTRLGGCKVANPRPRLTPLPRHCISHLKDGNETGWLSQQRFNSHSSGGWEVKDHSANRFSSGPLPVSQTSPPVSLCAHMMEREREGRNSGAFLIRALILSWGFHLMTSFQLPPNTLLPPKLPPHYLLKQPNLAIRASRYESWEGDHVQFITGTKVLAREPESMTKWKVIWVSLPSSSSSGSFKHLYPLPPARPCWPLWLSLSHEDILWTLS